MKKLTLVVVLSMLGTLAFGQWGEEQLSDKPDWKERIFFGGGLGGISFSSYYDYIAINALVGYKITPKLAGGVQVQYRYTKYKQYTPDFTANDYGVSPFLRFNFYGPLFLHAEYEYLNYAYINNQFEDDRKGFSSFMAGGGFFQPIGRRAGFYLAALYNFSYKDPTNSNDFYPYNSPFILRAGITAGF
jgi:hypothetical protein